MSQVMVTRNPTGAPPEAELVLLHVVGDALILELDDGEALEFAVDEFDAALALAHAEHEATEAA